MISRLEATSMSLLTPGQTPERSPQTFGPDEPSSPYSNLAIAVRPSPVKAMRALGSILQSPSPVSPSPSEIAESGEDEDEVQSTISSRSSPRNRTKQFGRGSILARLKSSRERQNARLSRVNHLISLIEKIQGEKYIGEKEAIRKQLFPKDYIELLLEIDERDRDFQLFFHHGLRYEYRESIHGKEQFTILMLSAFHVSIEKSIDYRLQRWREDLLGSKDYSTESRTAAEKIGAIGCQKMEFESNKTLRGDCSFEYEEGQYAHPPLIFEIAWSQSTDELEEKATELIEEGAGQIRTVIGLDFSKIHSIWDTIRDEVGNKLVTKRGPFTAFVWRAVFDRNGQQVSNADGRPRIRKSNYIFCDENGNADLSERLQLSLRDFVPARVIKAERWDRVKDMDDAKLELDATTMLGYLDKALRRQTHEDENSQPKKDRADQERRKRNEERAAKRKASAEKEHKRWAISSLVEIGGHRLRKLPGRT